MNPSLREAIRILNTCAELVSKDPHMAGTPFETAAHSWLTNAIRHLAYPDRDVYPKVRRSPKGNPIMKELSQ